MEMGQEPIRAGILGLGRSGWSIHALGLAEHPGYTVAAVADPAAERRDEAKQRFECAAYADPVELLSDKNVEVVVVATPSHTHAPLAIEALARGKHVVVEKPMGQSVTEIDQMISAANRAEKILTCYQPRRLDAEFVAIQELIASGGLGRIVMIRRGTYQFDRRADWQMLRKFGGGELSNTGPHLLDQLLLLLGEGPLDLFADLQHTVGAGDAEDHVKLTLKNRTGTVADLEITRCCAFPQPQWLILGTLGSLIRTPGGELSVKRLDPARLGELHVDEGPAAGRRYGTGERLEWRQETLKPEQTRSQALLFYDRLQATLRENAPLFVTPESIRRQIDIIERAREQTGLK